MRRAFLDICGKKEENSVRPVVKGITGITGKAGILL